MKKLFTENEVKHFNKTDKIKFVLDKLCIYLQATETSKKYTPPYYYYSKSPGYTIYTNTCNFDNAENINIPFNGIELKVTEEFINIKGSDFDFGFAPDQLLTIQKRFKKIKELK